MTRQTHHALASSLVRIRRPDGMISGSGFLLAEGFLCTCAHVIADALNLQHTLQEIPTQEVQIDFPFLSKTVQPAHVLTWQPIQPDEGGDIAILQLEGSSPQEAHPAPLLSNTDLAKRFFEVYGFPSGHDAGVWADGQLGYSLSNGWIQMEDTRSQGFRVQPGFSGSPVWEITGHGVIGMVVASVAHSDAETKVAFLIPNSAIVALFPQITPLLQPIVSPTLTNMAPDSLDIEKGEIEPIQSKRARLQKCEANFRHLKDQAVHYGTSLPAQLITEIEYEQQRIITLHREIRTELRETLSQLPAKRYTRFIGRGGQLGKILSQLDSQETHPIIAIDGIGGAGKTALARELASLAVAKDSFQAVVWESAKPAEFTGASTQSLFTAEIDFDNLLDMIGRKLGFFEVSSQRNTADKKKLVSTILQNERYLVVIDNLETITGYRELVDNLSGMFDRSKAVLTTRKKVADFLYISSVSLGGMDLEESIAFLRSVAQGKGEAGEIILQVSDATLQQIHDATGGLPLAMELIVGQAMRSSLNTVLNRFQSVNFRNIQHPDSDVDVYEKFFKFIYQDSWKQLSDKAQHLLIKLGVFDLNQGARLDRLTRMSRLNEEDLGDAIGELLEFSLVRRSFKSDQQIFHLHPMTHRFVQADLLQGDI